MWNVVVWYFLLTVVPYPSTSILWSVVFGGRPTPTARQASGGDRHLNFHEIRDNSLLVAHGRKGNWPHPPLVSESVYLN